MHARVVRRSGIRAASRRRAGRRSARRRRSSARGRLEHDADVAELQVEVEERRRASPSCSASATARFVARTLLPTPALRAEHGHDLAARSRVAGWPDVRRRSRDARWAIASVTAGTSGRPSSAETTSRHARLDRRRASARSSRGARRARRWDAPAVVPRSAISSARSLAMDGPDDEHVGPPGGARVGGGLQARRLEDVLLELVRTARSRERRESRRPASTTRMFATCPPYLSYSVCCVCPGVDGTCACSGGQQRELHLGVLLGEHDLLDVLAGESARVTLPRLRRLRSGTPQAPRPVRAHFRASAAARRRGSAPTSRGPQHLRARDHVRVICPVGSGRVTSTATSRRASRGRPRPAPRCTGSDTPRWSFGTV